MQTRDVLADAYGRIRDGFARAVQGLGGEALAWRPDDEANSIAWLAWHAFRVQDDHVSDIAGFEQAWTAGGWAEQLDLPFDRAATGYGHSSEEVAAVRPERPELLVGYGQAVTARTIDYLATLDADELDRVIDTSFDPPVTVAVRLVSVVEDCFQHLGQAAYVRGVWERRTG